MNKHKDKTIQAGLLTDEQRAMYKSKHGEENLLVLAMKNDEGVSIEHFVFKKPTMKTLSGFARYEQEDPIRAGQIVFNDCLVHGDTQAVNDPERFLAIMPKLERLMTPRLVEVEKL